MEITYSVSADLSHEQVMFACC